MTRTVRTLWITRKSIDGGFHSPELLEAWDDWSIDEYPEGWQEACKKSLDSVGHDLASHRYIDIRINEDELDEAFHPVEIQGRAVST